MSEDWCCERNGIGCDCGWDESDDGFYDEECGSVKAHYCLTPEEHQFWQNLDKFVNDVVTIPFTDEVPF